MFIHLKRKTCKYTENALPVAIDKKNKCDFVHFAPLLLRIKKNVLYSNKNLSHVLLSVNFYTSIISIYSIYIEIK